MAMAMHSVRLYPSEPWNAGIFPWGLTARNSLDNSLEVSVSTLSRAILFALATALIAVERGLSYDKSVSESVAL